MTPTPQPKVTPDVQIKAAITKLDALINDLENSQAKLIYYNQKREDLYTLLKEYNNSKSMLTEVIAMVANPTTLDLTFKPQTGV